MFAGATNLLKLHETNPNLTQKSQPTQITHSITHPTHSTPAIHSQPQPTSTTFLCILPQIDTSTALQINPKPLQNLHQSPIYILNTLFLTLRHCNPPSPPLWFTKYWKTFRKKHQNSYFLLIFCAIFSLHLCQCSTLTHQNLALSTLLLRLPNSKQFLPNKTTWNRNFLDHPNILP